MAYDIATAHQRRREAASRLPPLHNGRRDPLTYQEVAGVVERDQPDQAPPSPNMVDAGLEAAEHLLSLGCVPLMDLPTLRALYRRGGSDRQLAQKLARLRGVA